VRRLSYAILVAGMVASCSGGSGEEVPQGPGVGADSPEKAVARLVELLNVPDFQNASELAYPGHSALASLAEGATFGEVAEALAGGDRDVAANFWAGFAQGTGSFLTGTVETEPGEVEVEEELEFHQVWVTPPSGDERLMVTRESDGHRIDLFASFGGGLAARMIPPVERLLTTQTEDADRILDALREAVPSLLVAAAHEEVSAEASQDLVRLIELITRTS
jgi:hypothetical protein